MPKYTAIHFVNFHPSGETEIICPIEINIQMMEIRRGQWPSRGWDVNVPVNVPVERLAIIEVFLDCADQPEADYVCKANEWLSWLKQAFV